VEHFERRTVHSGSVWTHLSKAKVRGRAAASKIRRRGAAALALCLAASSAHAAPSMTGTFFGKGQPDSKESMYLDHFLADGRLHSQFRDCIKGKAYDSTEDGTWSVSGTMLTIKIATHNGIAMPRTDVYRVVSVTGQGFKDVYIPLNFPFDEHRVADNYEMPSCQLVS
jgi:hypothetical protein